MNVLPLSQITLDEYEKLIVTSKPCIFFQLPVYVH